MLPCADPAAQRLRGHVDQLHLVGGPNDRVRHGLPLRHAGDLLHHVVEGFQVLHVDRGDDVDPGVEQFLDACHRFSYLEPGTLVCANSSTSAILWLPGEHGGQVHLLEDRPVVLKPALGRPPGRQAGPPSAGARAPRRTPPPRRRRARTAGAPRQAWRRSADPRRRSQVDAKMAASRTARRGAVCRGAVRRGRDAVVVRSAEVCRGHRTGPTRILVANVFLAADVRHAWPASLLRFPGGTRSGESRHLAIVQIGPARDLLVKHAKDCGNSAGHACHAVAYEIQAPRSNRRRARRASSLP